MNYASRSQHAGGGSNGPRRDSEAPRKALLDVTPVDGGWRLLCPTTGDLMFLSGGRAEQCARRTALLLAQLGLEVEVRIHDRFNALAGTIHYFADDNESGPERA
jgi:hypothetical protein